MESTFVPRLLDNYWAKLSARVVFPTPPFWFAIAIVTIFISINRDGIYKLCGFGCMIKCAYVGMAECGFVGG